MGGRDGDGLFIPCPPNASVQTSYSQLGLGAVRDGGSSKSVTEIETRKGVAEVGVDYERASLQPVGNKAAKRCRQSERQRLRGVKLLGPFVGSWTFVRGGHACSFHLTT
ncbi:hypothetical protein AVEN_213002-1 [Araneus ventricosus]|uniref:Uncharacterized protein n=1 Tax=Araneus ventricosus TaxID=182803 RepID=A0A4Y2JSE9_ARAVE|nr:hypothetical protein AVEN_213002-1 [Araneus ventricosus]